MLNSSPLLHENSRLMISGLLLPSRPESRIDLTTVLRDEEVFLEQYTDKQGIFFLLACLPPRERKKHKTISLCPVSKCEAFLLLLVLACKQVDKVFKQELYQFLSEVVGMNCVARYWKTIDEELLSIFVKNFPSETLR